MIDQGVRPRPGATKRYSHLDVESVREAMQKAVDRMLEVGGAK